MPEIKPIWSDCVPRSDVLDGKLIAAELALSLSNIVWGGANPPYDDPKTFFDSTHPTINLKTIVSDVMKRLQGAGDVNPVIVLDVGFGGGKTHTLASLFYAVKNGAPQITKTSAPPNTLVVAISGDEHDSNGVKRRGTQIKTMWGDFFYQINKYKDYQDLDTPNQFPGTQRILEAIGDKPILILLDEIPTYFSTVSNDPNFLNNTVHFLHSLILAISSKSNGAIVMAIAEDAYRIYASNAKDVIRTAIEEAKTNLGAIYKRQQIEMRPIQDEDAVYVLKARLFQKISPESAKKAAVSYHELYTELPVPERYKEKSFREEIERCYPFHPDLIKVFYERIATIDGFNRTRGAVKLLASAIMKIWKEKEEDATLIHPFHIDLANENIANSLTIKIDEPKYRNAIESDVWNSKGTAVAQNIDKQSSSHWQGVPLARRACNTIYLYSLSAGKEGDKGIRQDSLAALLTTPARKEYFFRVRDTLVNLLLEDFHFVERQGERLLFIKKPSLIKVIQNQAKEIPTDEVMRVLVDTTSKLFSGDPQWMTVAKVFVSSKPDLPDDPVINIGILNPRMYSMSAAENVPTEISEFLDKKDDLGKKARINRNSSFLLVAEESQKQWLFSSAQRLLAARDIEYEPDKFGIDLERKPDIAKYRAEQESNVNDAIRAAFTYFVYWDKDGIKSKFFNPAGYSKAREGKQVVANLLSALHRILDKPFDPDHILYEAWVKGDKSKNADELYYQYHKKPGLSIPVTRDIFNETIRKGIENKLWVLDTDGRVVHFENLKGSPIITDKTMIILYEEAERLGLLKPPTVTTPTQPASPTSQMIPPIATESEIPFAEGYLEVIAESLPKRMKPNYDKVKSLHITTRNDPTHILKANFLLMKLASDKNCQGLVEAKVERYNQPEYNVTIRVSKEDLATMTGKKTVELARQFADPNIAQVSLTLQWQNGISGEEVEKLLREYGGNDKLIANVVARVSK